jgi:hypothetical protein
MVAPLQTETAVPVPTEAEPAQELAMDAVTPDRLQMSDEDKNAAMPAPSWGQDADIRLKGDQEGVAVSGTTDFSAVAANIDNRPQYAANPWEGLLASMNHVLDPIRDQLDQLCQTTASH